MTEIEIIKANRTITDRNKTHSLQLLRVGAYCRVSTDSEDQLNSYKSQVTYYTNLIKKNKDWVFADIYADEAITGTQVDKRTDFQRLINDCMNGELDMVITKSISRFARNTLDTLKYVRMLKEKNIAVYFEDEKINTLTMDGELLLVVLSSVAQQEVENISANVKKGLKMKMSRGELVGFQGCLGYDYYPEDKSISVNEEEAVIVKYIFNRYIEGAGGSVIGRELENLGYKTKRGSSRWAEFRKTLQNNQVLDEFDRYVFESIVEKVIVGGVEEDGTIDPHKLVFIYKTGLTDSQDGGKFKPKRKNTKKSKDVDITNPDLCSQASDEDSKMCSLACEHTCGECG
ncbi:recombinase family protein [Bacillus cytotoxicus]|uniref:recombinase family protein n=1 Tax=Bacillus cytotoxicus TaxID=580165 RepID=UPI003D7CED2D